MGPPLVSTLWLGVSKGMLPVKYIRNNKASICFSRMSLRLQENHKVLENLGVLSFRDITGSTTVMSDRTTINNSTYLFLWLVEEETLVLDIRARNQTPVKKQVARTPPSVKHQR